MRAAIFDIDGTLVDSSWQHTMAWKRACQDFGIERTAARIHHLIGMGGEEFLQNLLGEPNPEVKEAHGRYMKDLDSTITALPGAAEILIALHGLHVHVGIATSGGSDAAHKLLEKVVPDLSVIDSIVCADDVDTTKPAPDLVTLAAERSGLPPSDLILVGDTGWDARSAARAGVRCVGVKTGGWCEADLRDAGAIAVYEDLAALLDSLEESPLAVSG